MKLINALEYPNFHFADGYATDVLDMINTERTDCSGQYAYAVETNDTIVLARDPLGCNKLFYGRNDQNDLIAASRIDKAMELGVPLDGLASCPPGHVVRIDADGGSVSDGDDVSSMATGADFNIDTFRAAVEQKLEQTFAALKRDYPAAKFAICLSDYRRPGAEISG